MSTELSFNTKVQLILNTWLQPGIDPTMAANQLVFGVAAQASNLNPLAADQRRFSRYLWNKRKGLKYRLGGLGERAGLLELSAPDSRPAGSGCVAHLSGSFWAKTTQPEEEEDPRVTSSFTGTWVPAQLIEPEPVFSLFGVKIATCSNWKLTGLLMRTDQNPGSGLRTCLKPIGTRQNPSGTCQEPFRIHQDLSGTRQNPVWDPSEPVRI